MAVWCLCQLHAISLLVFFFSQPFWLELHPHSESLKHHLHYEMMAIYASRHEHYTSQTFRGICRHVPFSTLLSVISKAADITPSTRKIQSQATVLWDRKFQIRTRRPASLLCWFISPSADSSSSRVSTKSLLNFSP